MRLSVLAALVFTTASLAAAQTTAPWDYQGKHGALTWGRLDPALQGLLRGPRTVAHRHPRRASHKALKPIEFHYLAGSVAVENTAIPSRFT